jgi:hypothetical protein
MKRFLMLVGVAVVAAAMYVAASPASQQAKAPTEKQFLALKKQVARCEGRAQLNNSSGSPPTAQLTLLRKLLINPGSGERTIARASGACYWEGPASAATCCAS